MIQQLIVLLIFEGALKQLRRELWFFVSYLRKKNVMLGNTFSCFREG